MGSLRLLQRVPYSLHLRAFSLTAAETVYPAVDHSGLPSLVSLEENAFLDDAGVIPATDFVYRHSFADGPFAAFKTGRLSGLYRRDPRQEGVVLKLQELHQRLQKSHPTTHVDSGLTVVDNVQSSGSTVGRSNSNWFSGIVQMMSSGARLNGTASQSLSSPTGAVQGLYLHGGVGVGKTMLMDLFVAARPPSVKVILSTGAAGSGIHIHAKLKDLAQKQDPLSYVADFIRAEANVLALDELFVNDVADAMIINRLFKALWEQEMVLISTSNRHPDDLYLGGLQRDLFLPFIENLKQRCIIHDMESEIDYRKLASSNKGLYFTGEQRNRCLSTAFDHKTAGHTKHKNVQIHLKMGRRCLSVPLSAGPHCYYTFDEICGRPVGSSDYLGLCREFHTIFLQDIPVIESQNKSAAYRFVTLIDILYDNRIRVVCSAAGSVHEIFKNVISHAESTKQSIGDQVVVDDKLSFAKDRTISRLMEMGSMEYLAEHANRHAPELLLALAEVEEQSKQSLKHSS